MEALDTIAAIATPPGTGGIGVIRVSGPAAVCIAQRVFMPPRGRPLQHMESHRVYHGFVVNAGGERLDEALLCVMRQPRSYTREDVAEISCHGGILITQRVLDAVLAQGARVAEPGEFTKRAFLNGRLDLTQAEAVIDLITCAHGRQPPRRHGAAARDAVPSTARLTRTAPAGQHVSRSGY